MKLFEFFYIGMPVVSIEIEELKRFSDLVKIGTTSSQWEKIIKSFLSGQLPSDLKKKQRDYARANSWVIKVGKITHYLN